jgi:hypothetical protein
VVIFASPSFKGAGRYPPAKRKFRLVEMGTAHGVCPQWPVIGMPTLEITGVPGTELRSTSMPTYVTADRDQP